MKGLTANTKYCYMVGGTLVDENTLVKFLRDSSPFALTMKPGNAWVHIGSMVCLGPEMRVILDNRRKFRSQTSDNMDRWKAEMGRVREKRTVEERRIEERKKSEKRKSQKKEDAGARKGRKVAKHCVFPMICGSGGSKSRLAKAAEMKNCTPLLREAHFEVKMYKTHQVPTTFGSCDVEKVHAVVARSTCPSQNVQNTPGPDHFWKLRCRKSARRCGAKHISKSKCTKHNMFAPLFGGSDVLSRGTRKGLWTLSKVSKTWGFCGISQNAGRRGTFEENLQRCIFRGRRSTRDIFIRAVRRSGRWFPERGCILEHQIFRFAEIISGAALRMTWHHFFLVGAVV